MMELAKQIQEMIELQVRPSEDTERYFEAVMQTKDLDMLRMMLRKVIGEPLKPAGKVTRFTKEIKPLIDDIGGLRPEQSFYLKEESGDRYLYVALWPWQSDPSRITLKIGRGSFADLPKRKKLFFWQ